MVICNWIVVDTVNIFTRIYVVRLKPSATRLSVFSKATHNDKFTSMCTHILLNLFLQWTVLHFRLEDMMNRLFTTAMINF